MTFNHDLYTDRDTWVNELRKYKFVNGYKPKHEELFNYMHLTSGEQREFMNQYIHPEMDWARREGNYKYIIQEPIWEVYQFPLFTKKLCNMIIEEVEHFDCFLDKIKGPNKHRSYRTTETWLDSIPGTINDIDTPLGDFYRDVQYHYIKPILRNVWKFKPSDWYSSWVTRYKPDEQDHLIFHTDESVCASIISLNDDYEGGGTIFERQKKVIDKEAGWCTIHPSRLTHRHAGRLVTKGKRYILVTFIS